MKRIRTSKQLLLFKIINPQMNADERRYFKAIKDFISVHLRSSVDKNIFFSYKICQSGY